MKLRRLTVGAMTIAASALMTTSCGVPAKHQRTVDAPVQALDDEHRITAAFVPAMAPIPLPTRWEYGISDEFSVSLPFPALYYGQGNQRTSWSVGGVVFPFDLEPEEELDAPDTRQQVVKTSRTGATWILQARGKTKVGPDSAISGHLIGAHSPILNVGMVGFSYGVAFGEFEIAPSFRVVTWSQPGEGSDVSALSGSIFFLEPDWFRWHVLPALTLGASPNLIVSARDGSIEALPQLTATFRLGARYEGDNQ